MRIDPHVHCYPTIAETFELADEQGVDIIFGMPGHNQPTTNKKNLNDQLEKVPLGQEHRYFAYLGLTKDPEQITEAVKLYYKYPQVIGLKLFTGKSTGGLCVPDLKDQRIVYRTLEGFGYDGVLAIHAQKDSLTHPEIFDPARPISHCLAYPKKSEIEPVEEQTEMAYYLNFPGTLHFCHISCSESVAIIHYWRNRGLKVTCGVTPGHIMWDSEIMNGPDGLKYRILPPLRDEDTVRNLRKDLCAGDIDWIETDQARHSDQDKYNFPYLPGYPFLTKYREFVEQFLPRELGLTPEQITALTFGNIVQVFGPKLRRAGWNV